MKGVIFAVLASFAWGLAPILFKLGLKAEVSNLFALMVHNFSAFLLASLLFSGTHCLHLSPLERALCLCSAG